MDKRQLLALLAEVLNKNTRVVMNGEEIIDDPDVEPTLELNLLPETVAQEEWTVLNFQYWKTRTRRNLMKSIWVRSIYPMNVN